MSNRTMNNAPLPTIGSQNWGATLNNYLRTQHYEHAELQEELNNLYEQSTNTIQTVLSSGIVARNIDSQRPGLYANDQITYIEDGTQILSDASSYCGFKGYGVIIGGTNFTDILHSGEADDNKSQLKMTKTQVDEAFTSSETYDARCVYAYYNSTSKFWEVKFSSELTENNSISLNPYYICLGVIIKWNTNYYWHYKTMKANLSISSKKWMLDEPHAMLNTYISARGTANSMTLEPFADTNFPNATLTVQALGINPFTTYESGSNELSADIKQWNLNAYNTANNFQFIVLYKNKNNVIAPISTTSAGALTAITNLSSSATYRLCATAVTIAGKPLLILQKAYAGEGVSKSLFDEDEFGKILYFTDPVELYRLSINSSGNLTMTAAVGNGISTVNANGINPHVTTLIRHDDDVLFGEETSKAFHFKTKDEEMDSKFEVVMTQPDQPSDTSFVLTNAMYAIANPIKVQNYFEGTATSNRVDNYIKMYKGDNEASYHNITLATHQGGEGAYAHFTGQGYIKLGAYAESSSFNVDSDTPNASIYIKSKNRGTVDSNSNIQLTADYIDSHADGITGTTNDWRLNNETDDYCVIQYSGDKSQIHLGTDSSKKITMYAGTATEDPCILVGGGGTKLSSEGLYFPSGVNIDGIKIGNITGEEQGNTYKFTTITTATFDQWFGTSAGGWEHMPIDSLPDVQKDMVAAYKQNPGVIGDYDITNSVFYYCKTDEPLFTLRWGTPITIKWQDKDGNDHTLTTSNLTNWTHFSGYNLVDPDKQIVIFATPTPSNAKKLFTDDPTRINTFPAQDLYICGFAIKDAYASNNGYAEISRTDRTLLLNITGSVKNTSLYLQKLTGTSVIHIDEIEKNNHLSVRAMREGATSTFVNTMWGTINIYSNAKNINIKNNSGVVDIKKHTGSIQLHDKFHINGNFCYYDDGRVNYNNAITKIKQTDIIKNSPNFLWRVFGFQAGDDGANHCYHYNYGGVMLENKYSNEDDWIRSYYTFLPDLGIYNFMFEIWEDWSTDTNNKKDLGDTALWRMHGTCLRNDSITINLAEKSPDTEVADENNNIHKFFVLQTREAEVKPGVYLRPYIEQDRICIQVLIDARVDIANSSGNWAWRLKIRPIIDSTKYSYLTRVLPVCRIQ